MALPHLEGSKRPSCHALTVLSCRAQGMVLDATVDPNILSYPMPIIMRERGAVVRRGRASPWTSGEARRNLAFGGWARRSLALRVSARWSIALSPRVRRSCPPAIWGGGVNRRASGEAEPNSCHLGKKRSGAIVRSGVFNVRWLLVPTPWVPWYQVPDTNASNIKDSSDIL